jgi:hypothetical protein
LLNVRRLIIKEKASGFTYRDKFLDSKMLIC